MKVERGVFNAPVRRLYTQASMLKTAIEDIREGRLAYSKDPVHLEYLDSPHGSIFLITDGHHRVVEAIMRGRTTILARVDRYIPRVAAVARIARGMTDTNVFDEITRASRDVRRSRRRSKKKKRGFFARLFS